MSWRKESPNSEFHLLGTDKFIKFTFALHSWKELREQKWAAGEENYFEANKFIHF